MIYSFEFITLLKKPEARVNRPRWVCGLTKITNPTGKTKGQVSRSTKPSVICGLNVGFLLDDFYAVVRLDTMDYDL